MPDPLAAGLTHRQRLDALVERVKLEQSKVKSMQAQFHQYKESELLLQPEDAEGVFYYRAPDRVRWEYLKPDPRVMTVRGDQMLTYYPRDHRAESVAVGRLSEQIFRYLGAAGSLETLMKYFSLTAELPEQEGSEFHLLLEPRYERMKKRLESMELWIDGQTFMPVQLQYTEHGGDVTRYRFENLTINPGDISEDLFQLELPPGTEIKSTDLRHRGEGS